MRETVLIFTFIMIVSFHGQSQSYNSVISDNEIESFIQWEIDNTETYSEHRVLGIGKKKLMDKPVSWSKATIGELYYADTIVFEDRFYLFFENDTIFSEEDREFIKAQYESEIISEWKTEFENVNIKKHSRINYHRVTIPLFNKDKTKVIFWKLFYCGKLCAYSCMYVYEKCSENDWKEIMRYGCWIS